MNKARRKELYALIKELEKIDNQVDLQEYIDTLEAIKSDEEMYYDNAPENLQNSLRYEMSQEAIDSMEDAIDYLNDAQACENIKDFIICIECAIDYIINILA